jgi:hypothetical protein
MTRGLSRNMHTEQGVGKKAGGLKYWDVGRMGG